MKFGLKKCGVLVMKRGKVVKSEGIDLPDGRRMSKFSVNFVIYIYICIYLAGFSKRCSLKLCKKTSFCHKKPYFQTAVT